MVLQYKNKIAVAAHRGNSRFYPENTLVAFRSAIELGVDMVEIDLHMTKDGELILMHDHTVDRTSDGQGLIREKSLAEMKALDVGGWKNEKFKGERVPTFREFLELFRDQDEMLFNIELKDYPAASGDFAYRSAALAIAMMDEYGITERSVVNTWSGELNEWLAATYGTRLKIHAYYPQEWMGNKQQRFVYDYAYCVCLFGTKEKPVVDKSLFDFARSYGVEPWVYFNENADAYDAAIENGAVLFTANDPAWAMEHLRKKGLHQ